MRLVIVGCRSFIAQHVIREAEASGIEVLELPHDADISGAIRRHDTVVNFALNPASKKQAYDEALDCDLKAARAAARAGARFAMLSTRKVYPEAVLWNAPETAPCSGDGSHYGRNKAESEARILGLPGLSAAVFRLVNICGYEYRPSHPRPSFFGQMQGSLKTSGTIRFDMHPSTRRDFLPVESCARALVTACIRQVEGVYNLGSGFAVPCGDIAAWIMEGFGSGRLVVEPPVVRDEFYLNMDKWTAVFGCCPLRQDELRTYCIGVGRRLSCEKF